MGRPGRLGIRIGTKGAFGQLGITNFNAGLIAKELANIIKAASADLSLMNLNDEFLKNAQYRKDKDPDGYFDIIAHGSPYKIKFNYKGKDYLLKAKQLAKMLQHMKIYNGQPIRLLSCSTGMDPFGFAQNLANKLGVPVKAPNNILWNYSDKSGVFDIAPRKINNPKSPDLSKRGEFIIFYPKKRRK